VQSLCVLKGYSMADILRDVTLVLNKIDLPPKVHPSCSQGARVSTKKKLLYRGDLSSGYHILRVISCDIVLCLSE
jgi:hypothetical protein